MVDSLMVPRGLGAVECGCKVDVSSDPGSCVGFELGMLGVEGSIQTLSKSACGIVRGDGELSQLRVEGARWEPSSALLHISFASDLSLACRRIHL